MTDKQDDDDDVLNDWRELFAELDPDDTPQRAIDPASVAIGESNALVNAKRKRSLLAYLKRSGRRRAG